MNSIVLAVALVLVYVTGLIQGRLWESVLRIEETAQNDGEGARL